MKLPRWRPFIDLNWLSLRLKRFSSRPWGARPMRNTLLIAKREYLEQIKSKAFKLSTIGLPAALGVVFFIGYLSSLGLGGNKHMAIASNDAALADQLRIRLTSEKNSKAQVDV